MTTTMYPGAITGSHWYEDPYQGEFGVVTGDQVVCGK